MNSSLSLLAAASVTGKSKRTLWRRLADGSLQRAPDDAHGRTMLSTAQIATEVCLPLTTVDWACLQAADEGDPTAQCDMAVRLLSAGHEPNAQYWLEQAARQKHPEAMHWLAYCHLTGLGRAPDQNAGMVWLARAAAAGHVIAMRQMAGLQLSSK